MPSQESVLFRKFHAFKTSLNLDGIAKYTFTNKCQGSSQYMQRPLSANYDKCRYAIQYSLGLNCIKCTQGESGKSITFWVILYEKIVLYFGEVMGNFCSLVSFHLFIQVLFFFFLKWTKSFKSYSH